MAAVTETKTHELIAAHPTPLALLPMAKAATAAWGPPVIEGTTQRWVFAAPAELDAGVGGYLKIEDWPEDKVRLVASTSLASWLNENGRPGMPIVIRGRLAGLAFIRTLPFRLTLFGQQAVLRRLAQLARGQPVAVAPAPVGPVPPAVGLAREPHQRDADGGPGLAEARGQLGGRRPRRGHR